MKTTRAWNRSVRILLALMLSIACILSIAAMPASSAAEPFRYEHDPRLNPSAMADIVVDSNAVYGFAPSPDGSLSSYLAFDWSDPELVNGENGRLARIAYHESINEMYAMMDAMQIEGRSIEEIARSVSCKRNELRLAAYADDPEGLAAAKARNLEKYGHEEGPLPDELYAQYGSWETVLEKAFSTNSGMDACLGLYDDYYELYVMVGQVEDEHIARASREMTVAAFIDAARITPPDGITPRSWQRRSPLAFSRAMRTIRFARRTPSPASRPWCFSPVASPIWRKLLKPSRFPTSPTGRRPILTGSQKPGWYRTAVMASSARRTS